MDDKNIEINRNYGFAENILCASGTLEEALQLYELNGNPYFPLRLYREESGNMFVDYTHMLFKGNDPEYNVVSSFFKTDSDNVIFNGISGKKSGGFPYHHVLNLPNTATDIRFRQSGVRELVENDGLYEALENILASSYLYGLGYDSRGSMGVRCDVTPEKLSRFIDDVVSLKDYDPKSGPILKLIQWAKSIQDDSVFQELFKEKRKITESRIIAIYSERFEEVRYGLLKKGVKPEDVFDFLSPEVSSYHIEKKGKSSRRKPENHRIVKYKHPSDEELTEFAISKARQRMDELNEISAQMLALPTYLMQIQMKHLYQGAYLHKKLSSHGYPMTFPRISDDEGLLKVKNIYPMRMVLNEFREYPYSPRKKAVNSFNFTSSDQVIQVEGPNKRGKSEAWRTLHLLNLFSNAGYSFPASSITSGAVPNSHFISCKGMSGHGGSELERSVDGIRRRLRNIYQGDTVILDELGDSTNAPTALEIAKRTLPVLVENESRVLITSHHDAITPYIIQEHGGISFMPTPKGKREQRFKLIKSNGAIDYRAEETLNGMGFTLQSVNSHLPHEIRRSEKMPDINERIIDEEDETPF